MFSGCRVVESWMNDELVAAKRWPPFENGFSALFDRSLGRL
jgi:hypothetical protein